MNLINKCEEGLHKVYYTEFATGNLPKSRYSNIINKEYIMVMYLPKTIIQAYFIHHRTL